MKIYRECSDLEALLDRKFDFAPLAELQQEVRHQIEQLQRYGCLEPCEMMCVIEVESFDQVAELETQMGIPVLRNRWNGVEHEEYGFTPSWETAEQYDHWYVVVFVVSDDGFGYLVFVPKDHESVLPKLLEKHLG